MTKKRVSEKAPGFRTETGELGARAIALAALHVNEFILLQLQAVDLLSTREIYGLLKDAELTLRNAGEHVSDQNCLAASSIVETMLNGYLKSRV